MKDEKNSGWRGSAELWLQAAYEQLIDSGVDSVKVMPLAKELGLSRTSFYWHFQDRDALLDAIIALWEAKNTGNLVARCEAFAETITEAVFNLFDCWLSDDLFDARLDLAIRNWAMNDDNLLARLNHADNTRLAALKGMFSRYGYDKVQSETRAMTVLYTQVGYISMRVLEDKAARIERMPDYAMIFTGQRPDDAEIERFRARHPTEVAAAAEV